MSRKPKVSIAICQNCGKEFPFNDYGNRTPLYCGNDCRKITYKNRNLKVKENNEQYIGRKINEWLILDIIYKNGNAYAKAKCSCGETKEIFFSNILLGKSKSCGHREYGFGGRAINETGNSYGELTVLGLVPFEELTEKQKESKNLFWNCQCSCGNQIIVSGSRLRAGAVKSCGCLYSSGEKMISKLLRDNGIKFEKEISFKDLRNVLPLRFDFIVYPEDGGFYLIEFDGIQHYQPRSFGSNEDIDSIFEKVQKSDEKKNIYCKENNIPLIRIPYTHLLELTIEDLELSSKFLVK